MTTIRQNSDLATTCVAKSSGEVNTNTNIHTLQKYFISLVFIFLAIILSSCGGAGSCTNCSSGSLTVDMDSSDGGVANGATGVSLTPSIVLQFSTVMNPSTVNSTNVLLSTTPITPQSAKLTVGNSNIIQITNITANPNNTTFTFSPVSPLTSDTKYYVIVNSGAKTSTGASVTGSFSFTTGDFIAPTVSIISPSNGSSNVSTSPNIQLQFSEAVLNVNSTNVTLHELTATGTVVAIGQITSGGTNTYTFSPTTNLKYITKYYIVVDTGITDNATTPNHLAQQAQFNFTTGADTTAPTVSMTSPSNNATVLSTSQTVQLQFSEAVTGANATNISVHEGSATGTAVTIGTVSGGVNTSNLYTFSVSGLKENTSYYVVVGAGVKDTANNPLVETSFNFMTGDFTSPTVSMGLPVDNATNVAISPSIQLNFSEPVNGVSSTTITLHEGSATGTAVAIGTISGGTSTSNVYTFSPSASLSYSTTYYVVIGAGITDNSGKALTISGPYSFTTGASGPGPGPVATGPTVSMTTPTDNAINISTSPNIKLQFSEDVTNVDTTNVKLYEGTEATGTPVTISSITAGSSNDYTLSLGSNLKDNTKYTVVVGTGVMSTGIPSLPLNQKTTFSFTTGDSTAPTVTMNAPADNATGISTSQIIQLNFSEAVTGVDTTNVILHEGSTTGTAVAINTPTIIASSNNYTFQATAALKEQTTYYVVVGAGVKDAANNPLVVTSFHFTTGDFTNPTVLMNAPSSIIDVPINQVIQLNFSEEVSGVNTTNVKLREGNATNGIVKASTIANVTSTNNYTITPTSPLASGKTYYVVVDAGVTDKATPANALTKTTFSFATIKVELSSEPNELSLNDFTQKTIVIKNTGTVSVTNLRPPNLTGTPLVTNSMLTTCTFGKALAVGESCNYVVSVDYTQSSVTAKYDGSLDFGYSNGQANYTLSEPTAWSGLAYITNGGDQLVYKCPVAGVVTTPNNNGLGTCVATSVNGAELAGITVTGNTVYIVDSGSTPAITTCTITSNGDLSSCINSGSGFSSPKVITLSGGYAYIANSGSSVVSKCSVNNDGSLYDCGDSGGSGFNHPAGIVVSSTTAYITNSTGDTVSKCSVNNDGSLYDCGDSGGSGFHTPYGITLNGSNVYVANFDSSDSVVSKCSVNNDGSLFDCSYSGFSFILPTTIVVNNSYAYITNYTTNTINGCIINNDGSLSDCTDIGGGASINSPFGIAFKQ